MGAKPALATTSTAAIFQADQQFQGLTWLTPAVIFAADFTTLSLVFALTAAWRHTLTPGYHLSSCLEMAPCLVLLLAAFRLKGLYPGVLLHPAEEMRRVFACITGVFLLMASSTFLWHNAQSYSRSVFLISWAIGSPLVLLTRFASRRALSKKAWWGIPTVVMGSGAIAQRVVQKLEDGMLGLRVTAALDNDPCRHWPPDYPPLVGSLNLGKSLAAARHAEYCIVAMPEKSNNDLKHIIQDHCHGYRHVLLVPDMPGICSLGISARELGGEVGIEIPQKLFHKWSFFTKRTLDLLAGTLAILLASPLLVLIMALVKFTSAGHIFYSQKRRGYKGEVFTALKFRTMIQNADAVLANYLASNPAHLEEWRRDHKLKNDPRITSIGKWLRRLSLDELPQLFNILAGHMSLVGPRPIVDSEVIKYGRGYDLYTRVRPGLTGLWQVSGRNNTTYEERVAYDEYYVRNWSIWLDAYIIIRTVKVVLTGEGAY